MRRSVQVLVVGFASAVAFSMAGQAWAQDAPSPGSSGSPSTASSLSGLHLLTDEQFAAAKGISIEAIADLPVKQFQSGSSGAKIVEPNDPPQAWYLVAFSTQDPDGRDWPTRQGNSELGVAHYSDSHNLYSITAVETAYHEHPEVATGTHFEYGAVLEDNGDVIASIWVVGEQNDVTTDGVYATPDGRPVGTITAYCKNEPGNVCPDVVNQV